MASPNRPLSPHLQVYRPMYTMMLSILHRATGVALSGSLLLLAAWLLALASGADCYAWIARLLGSPLGWLVLAAVLAAFWYHFCTGIRHLVFDTGRCLEKREARLSARVAIVAVVVLTGASLLAMLHFGGRP